MVRAGSVVILDSVPSGHGKFKIIARNPLRNIGSVLTSRSEYVVVDNNLMTVPSDLRITHLNLYV